MKVYPHYDATVCGSAGLGEARSGEDGLGAHVESSMIALDVVMGSPSVTSAWGGHSCDVSES